MALLNQYVPNNLIDDKKFRQQNKQLRRGNQFQILDLSREGARFHVVGLP
jgi:hypothetical protein